MISGDVWDIQGIKKNIGGTVSQINILSFIDFYDNFLLQLTLRVLTLLNPSIYIIGEYCDPIIKFHLL